MVIAPQANLPSPLEPGQQFAFAKTIGESDLFFFSAISGDFAPQHVNDEYMAGTPFGRRIAHGGLMTCIMSSVAAAAARAAEANTDEVALSLGYDRVRFLAPVYIGDTLTVTYEVKTVDVERRRSSSDVRVMRGSDVVAVAKHLMKWV